MPLLVLDPGAVGFSVDLPLVTVVLVDFEGISEDFC